MLPSHRPLTPVSECGMPLKTVHSGVLTDAQGVPLDDGRGAHMPLFGFPPSPFAPSYRERQKRESGEGRKEQEYLIRVPTRSERSLVTSLQCLSAGLTEHL